MDGSFRLPAVEGAPSVVRKEVPARVRFEVFKRDKFTCQYCGENAPNVVLNCDHIDPVKNGGGGDIINLITSCRRCNGGKGAIPLSDHAAVDKQYAALAELEDRRQQLDMMVRWREELHGLQSDTVDVVCDHIAKRSRFVPNESGRNNIKRWLKRSSVNEVLEAIDDSFDMHLRFIDDQATKDSWEKAFGKIPDTIQLLRDESDRPYLRRLLYIQGIIRNRTKAKRYHCVEYLEHLVICGADINDMERRAKRMRSFDDFEGPYDAWLKSIGRAF